MSHPIDCSRQYSEGKSTNYKASCYVIYSLLFYFMCRKPDIPVMVLLSWRMNQTMNISSILNYFRSATHFVFS
jgi:hypothetical protein